MPRLLKPAHPRAHAPQQEKPRQWEARVPQRTVAPHLLQLEKTQEQQQRPSAKWINKYIFFNAERVQRKQKQTCGVKKKKIPRAECIQSHTHIPLEPEWQPCDPTSHQSWGAFLQVMYCLFMNCNQISIAIRPAICRALCYMLGNRCEQSMRGWSSHIIE